MFQRYDFSSPYFYAWIVKQSGTPSEERYPLWITDDGGDPTALKPVELTGLTATGSEAQLTLSSLAYLSSLTLTMNQGFVPEIEIVLTPPLDEARKIVDSYLLEYPISAIEVEFGYSTGKDGRVRSPRFQGIMQPPNVSFGTDVSITLKAQGTAGYYLGATGNNATLPKKKRVQHITDLVAELAGTVQPFDINRCLLTDDTRANLDEEIVLVNSGKSYLHLIYEIARGAGCWVRLSDETAGFSTVTLVAQDFVTRAQSQAVLAMFDFPFGSKLGSTVSSRGVFPIISVSVPQLDGLFLGPWAKTLMSNKVDPATLENTEASSDPTKIKVSGTQGKNQVGVNDKSTEVSAVSVDPTAGDETNAQAHQKKLEELVSRVSNGNSIAATLEIETLGIPDAVPNQIYQVTGISSRLDGFYMLQSVRHNLSSSGFTSSLTVIQNSSQLTQATNAREAMARAPTAAETAPPATNVDTPASDQVSVTATPQ